MNLFRKLDIAEKAILSITEHRDESHSIRMKATKALRDMLDREDKKMLAEVEAVDFNNRPKHDEGTLPVAAPAVEAAAPAPEAREATEAPAPVLRHVVHDVGEMNL